MMHTINNVSLNTSVFTNTESNMCKSRPLECAELSSTYLEQMKLLRFYSLGWISEPTLIEASVLNPDYFASQVLSDLDEFGRTCNNADPSQNTPCNKYTASLLRKIYGVDDLFVTIRGERRDMLANEIFAYLATQPNDWQLIGSASKQEALDKASFYANQGAAVVAVSRGKKHGHVAVVMPSLTIETSSSKGWRGLYLPKVTSFFIGRPEKSFYYKKISFAWSSPNGVYFYVKIPKD